MPQIPYLPGSRLKNPPPFHHDGAGIHILMHFVYFYISSLKYWKCSSKYSASISEEWTSHVILAHEEVPIDNDIPKMWRLHIFYVISRALKIEVHTSLPTPSPCHHYPVRVKFVFIQSSIERESINVSSSCFPFPSLLQYWTRLT